MTQLNNELNDKNFQVKINLLKEIPGAADFIKKGIATLALEKIAEQSTVIDQITVISTAFNALNEINDRFDLDPLVLEIHQAPIDVLAQIASKEVVILGKKVDEAEFGSSLQDTKAKIEADLGKEESVPDPILSIASKIRSQILADGGQDVEVRILKVDDDGNVTHVANLGEGGEAVSVESDDTPNSAEEDLGEGSHVHVATPGFEVRNLSPDDLQAILNGAGIHPDSVVNAEPDLPTTSAPLQPSVYLGNDATGLRVEALEKAQDGSNARGILYQAVGEKAPFFTTLQLQNKSVAGGVDGWTAEALLHVIEDRIKTVDSKQGATFESANAYQHVREALYWLNAHNEKVVDHNTAT